MKATVLMFLALLGGLAGGYFLPKGEGGGSAMRRDEAKGAPIPAMAAGEGSVELLEKHVASSIEDLVAAEGSSRLLRMTLWLIDASSDEIGELWQTLDEQGVIDHKTKDLIMIHWVERDPRAAISAAKKSGMESVAWWAWGRADPETALEAALREAPDHADSVLRSIGQFHIDLAMRLMEKHPEAVGWSSVEGIGSGLAKEDPGHAVEFLRTRGLQGDDALKAWAERDPEVAIAWVRQNMTGASTYEIDRFAEELAIEHPERMAAWLENLPSGTMRRSLASEHLRGLCERDMTAAVAFARGQEGLRMKRELLSLVGMSLAHEDPAASVGLLREAWALDGDGPSSQDLGSSATGMESINKWNQRLIETDPEGVIQMAAEVSADDEQRQLRWMMGKWMRWNEVEFAEWLIDHEPGPIRELGAFELSRQLVSHTNTVHNKPPDFESSLYWASSLTDPQIRSSQVDQTVRAWVQKDPEGAAEYFDGAAADANGRETYERHRRR